ncbi:MAG TPA: long-chain fatty acid--CoA ligase, partial [Allosphingosinicella sp.]
MLDPAPLWRNAYQHPAPWERSFAPMSLPALFDEAAKAAPYASAIDFLGRKYSYAETANGID